MRTICLAFALLVTSGCASGPLGPSRTFTPQQINQKPEAFDGRVVRIRGYVTIGVENRTIYESKALLQEGERRWKEAGFDPIPWKKYCLTLTNALDPTVDLLAYNHRTVEVLARVEKDYGAKTIDLGACAIDTGVEVLRVVSVED